MQSWDLTEDGESYDWDEIGGKGLSEKHYLKNLWHRRQNSKHMTHECGHVT